MYCRTNASEYDGSGASLLITMETPGYTQQWKFNADHRRKEVFIQTKENYSDDVEIDYKVLLVDQSMHEISGSTIIPQSTSFGFYVEFTKFEVSDLDYVIHAGDDTKPRSWLLGGFVYSRTRRTRGICSGKLLITYDNESKTETRRLDYNLLDEKLILAMEGVNPTQEAYRLRIENAFLWALDFDLDHSKELIEIRVQPTDIYKIEIIIDPSGEVDVNCRRL